jgi:glycosyltransferase involved in cell wall biosynthesis
MTRADDGGLHVLYVAWGFAPHQGPGVYRPLATVAELVHQGHRVTVLTADLATFDLVIGGDRSLLDDVPEGVRVVRVAMAQEQRDPLVNRWSAARLANPRAWAEKARADQVLAFPEWVYATWQPRAEAAATRIHELDPVDLVIATGNPYVDFTVALRLHVDHGVPYVLDDRDSWLLDVFTGDLSPLAERILPWLEFALSQALRMWFVNPPIADWHRRRFPQYADKIHVVENGWDTRFLDVGSLSAPKEPGAGLVYTYVGTVNRSLPLRLLADAWRLARAGSAQLAGAELRVVGQFGSGDRLTPDQAAIAAEFAPDGLILAGRQPKHQIGQVYADADVLVFIKEGSGMVTSGKVYEYVATGRPIVSVLEAEHDARRVLAGYPRWHDAAEHSPEGLAKAMLAALDDATDGEQRHAAALLYGASKTREAALRPALRDVFKVLSS